MLDDPFPRNEGGFSLLSELERLITHLLAVLGATLGQSSLMEQRVRQVLEALRAEYERLGRDFLTGLPLRGEFFANLAVALRDARRERDPYRVACLFIDCDDLKGHNSLGHHLAGDALIRAVAGAIRSNVPEINMVARHSGDEFTVFLPRIDLAHAQVVAERIRAAVERTGGLVKPGSCSVGVSISPDHGITPDTLMKAANDLMFVAKALGGNQVAAAA